ncbi:hypothetical protein E6H36_11005 [Candidatus Bathyarchaeota archaeon]|nr:MAG: hypothetical protein AUJ07_03500 [Crenarchaeota archaeon 13_1_40CM_3_53_5]TMI23244.1 MAG: hypothetical protein E6H36_11005 [Candidatus Bathyarchaeota archaeon]TMI33190.1 MAG: hypothetical protein E6H29_01030 [Candidatus Bathyarchaeota archaeon]
MEIDHCTFPDDLLYHLESNTWVRLAKDEAVVGVTSVLSAIAGKLTSARLKATGAIVHRGNSLGTLESIRLLGPIPSPISGRIKETNALVISKPKILNDSPYGEGWVARLETKNIDAERALLMNIHDAEETLRQKLKQYRAKCFKAFPDHELVEIGVECAVVLVRLDDLVLSIPTGDVVHIVSDDPTAYVEMVRWADRSGQSLVDWRNEGGLFHFIVKKTGAWDSE